MSMLSGFFIRALEVDGLNILKHTELRVLVVSEDRSMVSFIHGGHPKTAWVPNENIALDSRAMLKPRTITQNF